MDISLRDLIGNPEEFDFSRLGPALMSLTNWAIGLAGSVAVIFLVYGGILYLTSAGNTNQVEKAKGTITWSLIGLVVIIIAYAVVRYFSATVILNSPI